MKRIYVLLGGLYSFDGIATSAGMFTLITKLKAIPDTTVKWYLWANYAQCAKDMFAEGAVGQKTVLIGYSGGGWRATTVANTVKGPKDIDLMVLYDPSPSWNVEPIKDNVKHAVCYQNTEQMWVPFLGYIGGGKLTGKAQKIDIVPITEQHLSVQFDSSLHDRTISLVKSL